MSYLCDTCVLADCDFHSSDCNIRRNYNAYQQSRRAGIEPDADALEGVREFQKESRRRSTDAQREQRNAYQRNYRKEHQESHRKYMRDYRRKRRAKAGGVRAQ